MFKTIIIQYRKNNLLVDTKLLKIIIKCSWTIKRLIVTKIRLLFKLFKCVLN